MMNNQKTSWMLGFPLVPTPTVTSYPGQSLEGMIRRLTERKDEQQLISNTWDAEAPNGIFYLAALLVTLIFVAISVATDTRANEVGNDEGNELGSSSKVLRW